MFREFKIAKKIPAAVAVFVLIPVFLVMLALSSASDINEGSQEIHDNYLVSIINLTDARKHIYEEFVWLKSHIISPDDNAMRQAERQISDSNESLNKALKKFANTLDAGEETRLFNEFNNKLTKLHALREQILELSRTNDDVRADEIANTEYRTLFVDIQQQVQNMFKTNVDGAESFYQTNEDTYSASQSLLISVAIITLLLGVFIGWVMIISIQKPLTDATGKVKQIHQNRDLNLRLPVEGKDEITELSNMFNLMINSLREVIIEIDQSNNILNSESNSLVDTIHKASDNLRSSSEMLDGVQYSTTEITDSIDEIARSATQASGEAENSSKEAHLGMELQQQTINSVENLKSNMSTASSAVEGLSKDSDAIGSVLDVIRGIAEQTNLLALNAAIEAARAGEQGRGFAVVADEVRSLAQRTQESTSEIQSMIEKLQAGAQSSVQAMHDSVGALDATAELTAKTEQSLQNIVTIISNISLMNEQIASATEEQSVAVKEISNNVSTANQLSQASANSFENIQHSSSELKKIVSAYESIMAKFKL